MCHILLTPILCVIHRPMSQILLKHICEQELFKVTSGHSLFAIVNGRCVEDPRSMASDLNSNSLLSLDVVTNRDIIGIALANLIVSDNFNVSNLHCQNRQISTLLTHSTLRNYILFDIQFCMMFDLAMLLGAEAALETCFKIKSWVNVDFSIKACS